ncbi:amidohydrolase family protein [Paenibacillus sp. ATY16]|uniref:amidohydrolase family protein n=1 Tax=Paenibacillus sp. ATY16 TaxID=1759312 RepID=UPI00200D2DE2|nr:amidohydrolase family protein [Paenibacillus sp. ATY16]MCK9863011.1 amidohydrolase family protein [Paenibacillus sp. ATY16]
MEKRLLIQQINMNGRIGTLIIEKGRVAKFDSSEVASEREDSVWNARGMLLLPAFRDAHVHLDKAFPPDRWISRTPVSSILDQFQLEKELLASCKNRRKELAVRTLEAMLAAGTVEARVHVDIDPDIGLSHLELMLQLKEDFASRMAIELVAFPQQGLLRSQSTPYIREALRMGADLVGGVDPAGVDRHVELSLHTMFELAAEFDKRIDLHLHDPGHLGVYTIEKMLEYSAEAGMKGKVTVSHAYGLGEVDTGLVAELGSRMAGEEMDLVTSVPIDTAMPPVPLLAKQGVKVSLATDHTGLDAWTPYGHPDILRRGRLLAEKQVWNDDLRMASVFQWMSNGSLELKAGDAADFVLVHALNAPHALAALPKRQLVCKAGLPVAGALWQGKSNDNAWNNIPERSESPDEYDSLFGDNR